MHQKSILDVTFLQNGWKFFHNTFSAPSKQYFLSHEPSQPIGRAGLSAWRPEKHKYQNLVIWRNFGKSFQDMTILDVIFL